jgi:membrane fusion protein
VLGFIALSLSIELDMKKDVPAEITSPNEVKLRGFSGLVTRVLAEQGQDVARGAPLFEVSRDLSAAGDGTSLPRFTARYTENRVQLIDGQHAQRRHEVDARIASLKEAMANRRQELQLLNQELAEGEQMLGAAQRTLSRLEAASDYVMADRIEQAATELGTRRITLSQRRARKHELLSEISGTEARLVEAQSTRQSQDIQRERDTDDAKLDYERSRYTSLIAAPEAGRVTFSRLAQGTQLKESDVAMVLERERPARLRALLRISSRQRGFIKVGQAVRLKLDAFPYAKFGTYPATITAISRSTVAPSGAPLAALVSGAGSAAAPGDDTDYIAYAELAGNEFHIQRRRYEILAGMRATASVTVERRTIAEWALAPLFEVLRG